MAFLCTRIQHTYTLQLIYNITFNLNIIHVGTQYTADTCGFTLLQASCHSIIVNRESVALHSILKWLSMQQSGFPASIKAVLSWITWSCRHGLKSLEPLSLSPDHRRASRLHTSSSRTDRNAAIHWSVPFSTALPLRTRECHSGPGRRQVWAFSCHFWGSGPGTPPQTWRWTVRNVPGNSRKPPSRAPRGYSARRFCVCVWTLWRSWCRSWGWWPTRPYNKWRRPRPCW